MFDGTAKVGNVQWKLKHEAHSMRTVSKKGEPTYIFSGVDEKDPEAFYAVILKKGGHMKRCMTTCMDCVPSAWCDNARHHWATLEATSS